MTFLRSLAAASAALILLTGASATSLAQSKQLGTLSVIDPWTRATPPKARTAGGFVTIENSGEEPDRLVGVASPIAGRVEIHEMRMENGTMIMRPAVGGIEIPAGGKATLAPGGMHIMFMDLNEGLVEGNTAPVVLSFEVAGDIEMLFPVEAIGARGPAGADEHDTHIMDDADMHGNQVHGGHAHGEDSERSHMNGHGQ
jgi:hypothetical protein